MAARYWVGGTATWDATAGTKWSATNGGAGGASVPTAADDVYFTSSSSGTCTLATGRTCRSINFTGFTGTFNFSTFTLTVGDSTAGASNVAVLFSSGMTLTLGFGSQITLASTSATQQTFTSGGKLMPHIRQNSGNYIQGDAIVQGLFLTIYNFTHIAGTWDTGNYNYQTLGNYTSSGAGTRTLTWGSSTIQASSFVFTNSTNLTLNAGTSLLRNTGTNLNLQTSTNLTFYDIEVQGTGITIGGGNNTPTNLVTNAHSIVSISGTKDFFQFTGTLNVDTITFAGASATDKMRLNTTDATYPGYLNVNNLTIDHCNIYGVNAGGSANWNLSSLDVGDAGGNTGITFRTPKTWYWVGGTGNFSSYSTRLSSTSGGTANGTEYPYPHDTIKFDANSFTASGQTVTFDLPTQYHPSLDFRGVTNSPTIAASGSLSLFGNLYHFDSSLTASGITTYNFGHGSDWDLYSHGFGFGSATLSSPNGYMHIRDTFSGTATLSFTGKLYTHDNDISIDRIIFGSATSQTNPSEAYLGSSAINLGVSGNAVTMIQFGGPLNCIVDSGTSVITVATASASARTMQLNGRTWNHIRYVLSGSTGQLDITTGGYIKKFEFRDASNTRTLNITAGQNIQVDDMDGVRGTSSFPMVIQSTTATNALITKVSGFVSTDYLTLDDVTASGAAKFYAGSNSTIFQDSPNWILTPPPFSGSFLPFF